MKGRRESEVSAGVQAYLSMRTDFWWWRANVQAGIAPSGRFMRSGVRGQADIQGILAPEGRFVGIELKRERGGALSEAQETWGKNVTAHGGLYLVARSVADVEQGLGPIRAHVVKVMKERIIPR